MYKVLKKMLVWFVITGLLTFLFKVLFKASCILEPSSL